MENVHNLVIYHGFSGENFSITIPCGYLEPFVKIIGFCEITVMETGYLITSDRSVFAPLKKQKTVEFLKKFCEINLLEIKGVGI